MSRFVSIVGAPRCGTTSLSRYLRAHPAICFASVKEPHFFSQHDLTGLGRRELRETVQRDYLDRYFADCRDGRMLADGSVTYLYAAEQMAPILKLWPDARFVIVLRDPLEMLPSVHQRLLYLGDETVEDFDTAWRLRAERASGRSIPRSCVEPRWLQYGEIGRLGHYVRRFFEAVGRDRCLVVLFDDLKKDPGREYRRVLRFLGLADDGRSHFPVRRSSRGYRFGWLQRLLKRPPVATRVLLAGEHYRTRVRKTRTRPKRDSALAGWLMAGRKRLLRWNQAPASPTQVSPEVRQEIRDLLEGDIAQLGMLLGRDLSHWLGGTERPARSAAA